MGVPTVKFYQFSSSGVDPAGSRHLTNHASFIKEVAASVTGALDFGTLNIDGALNHSATKALIFRTSNLDGGTRIENMRFWAPALPTPAGNIYFNFKSIAPYVSGIQLTNASGQIPQSLPSQNVYRTDGHTALSGTGDSEVSRWIYMNVTVDDTTANVNIEPDANFRYRMTFDYI